MQDILAARQGETSSAAEEAPSLVQAVWRERWVVLVCVVLAGVAGFLLSNLQKPQYTATAAVYLSANAEFDPLDTNQFNSDSARFVADQAQVMKSTPVLKQAITSLNMGNVTPTQLGQDIKVTSAADNSVITVQATAGDPKSAKQIADGVVAAYKSTKAAEVKQKVQLARTQSSGLTGTAGDNIAGKAALYGDGTSQFDEADLPTGPSSPQPIRNALILALIGFIAACGYALYTQSWSRRRAGPNEASAIFGAPVLSEIPDRGRIAGEDAIAAAYSEPGDAYRMAAVGLDYIRGTAPGVFLVTAPHDGAGTSLTALNLAAAAADHGRRVFLLNIEDTVRPQSETDAGLLRVPLHDLAQGRIDLGHAVERRAASRAQFGIIRLQVLQPVQGHPVADVQQILDQLPDDTDLVLLDSPPLPASSASFVLAGQVDAAVVVVDQGTTPADLEELQRRCRLAGIPVAGVLVNHIHRQSAGGRRKRRASTNSVPPRMYDTSPRGLPILTGGSALDDGRLHLPDSPQDQYPAAFGVGRNADYPQSPVDGYPGQTQPAPQGYPQNGYGNRPQQPQQQPNQGAEVPWSAVTRVTPGWNDDERR